MYECRVLPGGKKGNFRAELTVFVFLPGIVRHRRLARFSRKAANRWLLAVMLLRNPSLLRYRRQGGVTRFVDLRRASINSVVGILN